MAQTHDYTTQHICPACSFGPFTRNNYFTGKLLVERDFTDETRFHMEKLRHHEQQLHGWGVVCGLKVKPHENPACQERFICIEPGSAVDCCGHDIVVREQECLDITQLESIKALRKKEGSNPEGRLSHTLQVCLRYRECPTEEIPVLYDECGCDDTQCAPNRILESYEIDVMVDPKEEPASFHTPKLTWESSLAIAHAAHVAVHETSHRLYVVTADDPATVYHISTDNHATVTSRTLPAKIVAQAVSNDGKHLYVVVAPTTPATLQQLHVLDTMQPGMPDFNTNPIGLLNSANSAVELAVMPDGRLLALVALSGDVLRWGTDLDTNPSPAAPTTVANVGANAQGLLLSSDGKRAFLLAPTKQIQQINALDTTTPTVAVVTVLLPTAKPSSMALVSSTAPDMLAVADQTNRLLHLIALSPAASLVGSVTLDHPPIALIVSPGGHWAYVLEKDTTGCFVQSVSIDRLLQKLPVKPSEEFKIGNDSRQIIINKSGTQLYIPYVDDLTKPALGGVAVLEVSELSCEEILWRHLEGCPHCDSPNCVVLATITDYRIDGPINDANIDNRKGRRLLPSTQVLTELIECLLEHGTPGGGTQGPPGAPGKDGKDGAPSVGERGPVGPPGPGLEEGLTRIEALSWSHNRNHQSGVPLGPSSFFVMVDRLDGSKTPGLIIGFTAEVQVSKTIDASHVFQVLAPSSTGPDDPNTARGLVCRCPIQGSTIPVNLKLNAQGSIVVNAAGRIDVAGEVSPGSARGVAFLLDGEQVRIARQIVNGAIPELWIVLRGDFVIDAQDRAIDAEFVRAELPSGDRPKNSKFGIQGGLFESWFQIRQG